MRPLPHIDGTQGVPRISAIGNLLWFIFGGFSWALAGRWLAGMLCSITIVGMPWAKACFVIGPFAFFPFGKEAISLEALSGTEEIGAGPLGMIGKPLAGIFRLPEHFFDRHESGALGQRSTREIIWPVIRFSFFQAWDI